MGIGKMSVNQIITCNNPEEPHFLTVRLELRNYLRLIVSTYLKGLINIIMK